MPALLETDGARQRCVWRCLRLASPRAAELLEELARRLVGRENEAHEQERRSATARTELDASREPDHVVNDTVASTPPRELRDLRIKQLEQRL